MTFTPEEKAILDVFSGTSPKPRFQQVSSALLKTDERIAATRALVRKGILARLAGGEYWLTEQGVQLLHYS